MGETTHINLNGASNREMCDQTAGLPRVAITMGDPAGVGPEIILKALSEEAVSRSCISTVVGDPEVLAGMAKSIGWEGEIIPITTVSDARPGTRRVYVIVPEGMPTAGFTPGIPTVKGARAAAQFIEKAVGMALAHEVAAIATCPINKAMLNDAGYAYEGHTQMIAALTGVDECVMMLAGERLRVSLVTIHVPLCKVAELLTEANVFNTISITCQALKKDFGLAKPCIAVAALNPHAGEGGLFGCEDDEIIRPAVAKARMQGMDARGPFPSDTLFWRAAEGEFDAVVAMYHDQGLGPLKLLHFYDAVNVTLGLPIVRTSVDHGTAYDLAGTGRASHSSLVSALRMAAMIARNRSRNG